MKIIEKEFNALTGKETITERDMTADEIAEWQAAQAKRAAQVVAEADKEAARQAVLKKLGITADDLAVLGL